MSFGRKHSAGQEPLSGQRLRERALDLLSRRDHSEVELSRKLKQKGAVVEELPSLLADMKARGYLDDKRFAENFVRFRSGNAWGARRYRQELLVRGVSRDLVDSVLASLPELSEEAVDNKLERLVKREMDRNRPPEKIVASLARRGFVHAQVRKVLNSIMTEL